MTTSIPARELLASGDCTAACLLSWAPHGPDCACRCRGEYHGLLADASVEVNEDRHLYRDRVECGACGCANIVYALERGNKCARCGSNVYTSAPRIREEIGYRRGFQQGYAAARALLGTTNEADAINSKIYRWRYNWRSVRRCADADPGSPPADWREWPHFAWPLQYRRTGKLPRT